MHMQNINILTASIRCTCKTLISYCLCQRAAWSDQVHMQNLITAKCSRKHKHQELHIATGAKIENQSANMEMHMQENATIVHDLMQNFTQIVKQSTICTMMSYTGTSEPHIRTPFPTIPGSNYVNIQVPMTVREGC